MKTRLFLAALVFLLARGAGATCTGDYTADKDKSGDFDPAKVSARELVANAVECGLTSVARNGWTQLSQLSLEQVRARLNEIDMKYVDQIPADKLPTDQRQRKSGCYHIIENGHWSIYMVPDQLRHHHMGENYLLAFHELVSTISPVADREYALTLEYEIKMLQKKTAELDAQGLTPILFPPIPGFDTRTTGIIISGGGDLDTIWIKRQLRNYVFDFLLPEYLRTHDPALQSKLKDLVTTETVCPIETDHTQPDPNHYVFDDVSVLPSLTVSPGFLQKTYNQRLSQTHDPAAAKQAAYADAFKALVGEFQTRTSTWPSRCLMH